MPAHPHVPHGGVAHCACGEPNQPELTARHGLFYGSVRRRPHWAYQPDRRVAYKSKKYPWLVAAYRFHNKVSGRAGCGVYLSACGEGGNERARKRGRERERKSLCLCLCLCLRVVVCVHVEVVCVRVCVCARAEIVVAAVVVGAPHLAPTRRHFIVIIPLRTRALG